MKQLTCEMCGSTDLMKQDGVFVCQSCGTKYSVEEAKKMMVEGTVDVTGSTVKVDTSGELANLYQIARRAKDDNNGENAAKYYDMVLMKDPTSWEASFYVVYFKAMECKIAQIQSAGISVANCIDTVLKLIKDNVSSKDEQKAAYTEVANRVMVISGMLFYGAKNHYDGIDIQIRSNYTQEWINNGFAAMQCVYTLGDNLDLLFGTDTEANQLSASAWKQGVAWHQSLMGNLVDKDGNRNVVNGYVSKIENTTVHIQHLKKTQVVAISLPLFTVPTIARKYGPCAASVTIPLLKLGMAEHSSALITQSAPPSLSGSGIPSGSKNVERQT